MKNWLDIQKFHTISIKKYSLTKMNPKDITKRVLLLTYFQISSLKYKTEEDIVKLCEDLYDFKYKVRQDQQGKYLLICFTGSAIDPKYIKDKAYTLDTIFQAFEDLTTPYIKGNSFDKKTFQKAKKLLKTALEKGDKYPETKANEFAFHTFFHDTLRGISLRGDKEELKRITIEDLYSYYLDYEKEEKATYILGDISESYKFEIYNTLTPHYDQNFTERNPIDKKMYIKPYPCKQMYLRIIYDTKIFTGDFDLYPLMLMNHALGGSSYSHLFRTVREKYGLCYTIDSLCFGASGIVLINAEINKKDLNIAIEKIEEAIQTLLNTFDLEKLKKEFILQFKGGYDTPGIYIGDQFRKDGFPSSYDKDTYIERIHSITMEDIQRILKIFTKENQTIFAFGGDLDE